MNQVPKGPQGFKRWFREWFYGWVRCPTCGQSVPDYNFGIHSDWHFRQEMKGAFPSA